MVARLSPFLILALLAVLGGCTGGAAPAATHLPVSFGGRQFNLELALDDDTRYQGLSDRAEIAADGGMLFAFPDASVRAFVMRRCLVPIDIIFVGANGRIVQMHEMQVEPYDRSDRELTHYSSVYPAQIAIELRGGTLDQLELRRGDKVDLPMNDLKRWAR